jgi:hypothetical protein
MADKKSAVNTAKSSKFRLINPFASGSSFAGRMGRLLLLIIVLYLLATPIIGLHAYYRAFTPFFDPSEPFIAEGAQKPAQGVVFTDSLIKLGDQLMVAWLPNDKIYPTIFLDNPQNFQMGQLEVLRYSTRVLRDKLSRQRTTDKIDRHADRAFTDFSNNPHFWLFPSAESKYKGGIKALQEYRAGLEAGTSRFYPRADNLIELLDQLTSLLGGENTRLSNAPRDWTERLSEETAGDRYTEGETLKRVEVSWWNIDDNFYHARGVAYALRHVLMAVSWDFADILKLKRADELMTNILAELALANFEPLLVLNGSRDSVFANHSLSLMATLENVRQKLVNIQHMVEQ